LNDCSLPLDNAQPDLKLDHNGLTGQKSKVPFAAEADAFLLQMPSGDCALISRSAVAVDPDKDLNLTRPTSKIRLNAIPIRYVSLSDWQKNRVRSAGLILTAGDALGGWSAVIDRTVTFLNDRSQFGHRLSDFQAVRHTLANLAAELESARSLLWYAAALWDEDSADTLRTALIAKAHITSLAVAAARQCVVLHGAIGYAWECDIQIWLKRLIGAAQWVGSPRSLRLEAAKMRFNDTLGHHKVA
jgi:Acyl-CoA dehydrogenase, C-terminal domain